MVEVRGDILTGDEALHVGEVGTILGDVGLRGNDAGAEKVGVTNGETGAGLYAGRLSTTSGRSGKPVAGQTLSHMCSGDLSVGVEERRDRLDPASGSGDGRFSSVPNSGDDPGP